MGESRTDFLQRRANEMRDNPTKAEKRLDRLLGTGWQQQVPLFNNYIADFYHPVYQVVIEADGKYHDDSVQVVRDRFRDADMASSGILVIRFTNIQILKQASWVVEAVQRQIATLCRAKGLPVPGEKHSPVRRLSKERRANIRQKRLNGGKRTFHVIPERDPIDEL